MKSLQVSKETRRGTHPVVTQELGSEAFKYTPCCVESFSDGWYQSFFQQNNQIVDMACASGLDSGGALGEAYQRFYDLGMRVSQQLPGAVRERTEELYYQALKDIEGTLLAAMVETKTRRKNENLEKLVADGALDGVPDSDKGRIREMVQKLKDTPIDDYSQAKRGLDISRRLEKLAADRQGRSVILEPYFRISPELKADYLEVVKYQQIHGTKIDWFDDGSDKLVEIAKVIGIENTKLYLKALKMELARDDREFYDFYEFTCREGEKLNEVQRKLFFNTLVKAQEENLPCYREILPLDAARLVGKCTIEEARAIVDKAFAKFRKTGEEDAALKHIASVLGGVGE